MIHSIQKLIFAAAIVPTVCGFTNSFASENEAEKPAVTQKHFVCEVGSEFYLDHPQSDKHYINKVGHLAGEIGAIVTAKYSRYRTEVLPKHRAQLEELEQAFDKKKYQALKQNVQSSENPDEADVKAFVDIKSLRDALTLKEAEVLYLEDKQRENKNIALMINDIPRLMQKCFSWQASDNSDNHLSTGERNKHECGRTPVRYAVLNDLYTEGSSDEEKEMIDLFNKFNQVFSTHLDELVESKSEIMDAGENSLSTRKLFSRNSRHKQSIDKISKWLVEKLSITPQTNQYYPEESQMESMVRPFLLENLTRLNSTVKKLTPRADLYNAFRDACVAFKQEKDSSTAKSDANDASSTR